MEKVSKHEPITITDERMTRFMITLEQGVKLVWHAFEDMIGGEIYVKKIPSMNIMDIAKAVSEKSKTEIIIEEEESSDKPSYDQLVKIVQELSIKYIYR